jgi:hypothetical protein
VSIARHASVGTETAEAVTLFAKKSRTVSRLQAAAETQTQEANSKKLVKIELWAFGEKAIIYNILLK